VFQGINNKKEMKSFQLMINGKVDIHTNIFESDNLQRMIYIKFNPKNRNTYFIFSDYDTLLERVIECNSDTTLDSKWKPFNGEKILEENKSFLVTAQTTLLEPALNWINGDVDDLYF
jgi:hypothetical protein